MQPCPTLPAHQMDAIPSTQCVFVDVRTDMEYAEKHLCRPHIHIPLDKLNPAQDMHRLGHTNATPIYIVCRSGMRAAKAAEKFKADGFANVFVIDGGLEACEASGQKLQGNVISGTSSTLPLERQVRIAAGMLIVVGAFLGLTANPAFTYIPLFVGCGLIFAGITNRCGMALLLTHAPWNKKSAHCCSTRH